MNLIKRFFDKRGSDSSSVGGREISVERAMKFSRDFDELGRLYMFLRHYVEYLLITEKTIEGKIEAIQQETDQALLEGQLMKELWSIRYAILHVWFLELRKPKDQFDVGLVRRAFGDSLEKRGKAEYLSWLTDGFAEYAGTGELKIQDVKGFKKEFPDKLAERVPHIAFECTEGRLAGELNDFVVELIMTTTQEDRKAFELADNTSVTEQEIQDIRKTIDSMKPTRENLEEFFNALA